MMFVFHITIEQCSIKIPADFNLFDRQSYRQVEAADIFNGSFRFFQVLKILVTELNNRDQLSNKIFFSH